jgi:hypothetical protein
MSKKTLGQFYTTNYEYILQGFNIPKIYNEAYQAELDELRYLINLI